MMMPSQHLVKEISNVEPNHADRDDERIETSKGPKSKVKFPNPVRVVRRIQVCAISFSRHCPVRVISDVVMIAT